MEKNFKTIDEQIEILKEKNLIIEDEETAKDMIEEIEDSSSNKMMNDLFSQKPENPLESNEDETGAGEEE